MPPPWARQCGRGRRDRARSGIQLACLAWLSILALVATACTGSERARDPSTSASAPRSSASTAPPVSGPRKQPSDTDPVVAAAGDIARFDCVYCGDVLTAALVEQINPTAVLALGDEQYPSGALRDFQTGYHHTWGVFKDKTKPVPGDHEYRTPGAAGYARYFGRAAKPKGKTYYSFDLGGWHLIALDSNIARGRGSAQERWLRADLRATSERCILAFWHTPRFASRSRRGGDLSVGAFWADLYAAGADVVLNGHWHLYERLAPLDPNGRTDAQRGIRQFVVGTAGGPFHRPPGRRLATSERLFTGTYGVLKLTLHVASYTWQFVAVDGSIKDSGGRACH